jgi:hypothetical protein
MKKNIMKSYFKLGALSVAILVLAILHHIFTISGMALEWVGKAIGRLRFPYVQIIIKMADTELRYIQVKEHLKKSMEQNQSFYTKL